MKFFTLSVLMGILTCFSPGCKEQKARIHYNRGVAEFDKENYNAAIKEFNTAISSKPDYADALYSLGLAKYMIHDSTAIFDMDRAIKYDSVRVDAYLYRGVISSEAGVYKSAVRDFNKAIQLKPDYAEAYFFRGNTKLQLGNYEEAIRDLDKAVSIQPGYEAAIYTRGLTRVTQKDYSGAIVDFTTTIQSGGSYVANAYYFRGLSFSNLDENDKACEDFKTSFDKGYKDAEVYINETCK